MLVAGITIVLIWIFLQTAIQRIEDVQAKWLGYEREATQRTVLLSELHSVIGYGGFIHNYKNYILRGSQAYLNKVEADKLKIQDILSQFREFSLTAKEIKAIGVLENTFKEYFEKFDSASVDSYIGMTPGIIDRRVQVDDRPALQALKELTKVVVERGMTLRGGTVVAISDTTEIIKLGGLLIPVIILSSGLFFIIYSQARRAQHEATHSQERFQAVLEAVPDSIIVSDKQGRIILANAHVENLLGYGHQEMEGMFIEELVPDSYVEEHVSHRSEFHKNKVSRPMGEMMNIFALRKDGQEVPVDIGLGLFEIAGEPFAVASIRDMRNKREMEELLYEAKEEAETFTRSKTEFLANMSHELRTPLNAIIGFSESLLSRSFGPFSNDKQEEYITHVHQSGAHLLNIINDILDLSKVDAGKLELVEENVNLPEIMRECCQMTEKLALEKNIHVSNKLDDISLVLRADRTRMKQMMLNLVSNALKFTEDNGQVYIEAELHPDGSSEVSVRDNGIGMSIEEMKIALEPFGQVDSGLTRMQEGTGLGLPLTKRLAELHGGRLDVISAKGKGSVVKITMPSKRIVSTNLLAS